VQCEFKGLVVECKPFMNILSTVIFDSGTAFRWLVGREQVRCRAGSDDKIVEELMGKY
jgi:hypothetical protein